MIGLWHYSTPGLFIFAQYSLGILVATDIFVSNNIAHSVSELESPSGEDPNGALDEDQEDRKVAVLAVIAWFVRRSAHVISLILIFNVGMKEGLLHAVYSKINLQMSHVCLYPSDGLVILSYNDLLVMGTHSAFIISSSLKF